MHVHDDAQTSKMVNGLKDGEALLLENVRFYKGIPSPPPRLSSPILLPVFRPAMINLALIFLANSNLIATNVWQRRRRTTLSSPRSLRLPSTCT